MHPDVAQRSDWQQLERDLLATESELRDIKAALDEHSIVAITDRAGRITYANDKFCALSKYRREELIGQDHRIINSGHHPSSFFADLWATIGQGRVWHGEIRNRAKDGSFYWVDTTIFPFVGNDGRPLQHIAIRTDITQRKADEEELHRVAAELAEKNRELEAIVYTVSHDLRSPLVNVQGFSRQLERACESLRAAVADAAGPNDLQPIRPLLETKIPQALRFIQAGATKMDLLISGLLRYSRSGKAALTIRPLNMDGVVAEILAALAFQIQETGATVQVEPLPTCLADAVQTGQVFSNLIDNAIKYRHPGRPLRIAVTGAVVDGLAVYSVSDNGLGIAPEHQGKVFEMFHRLHPDTTAGEGLGLAIAQRVLERQRGRIWVESSAGEGSIFKVALPMPQVARPAVAR